MGFGYPITIIRYQGRRLAMTLMKRFCSSKIFIWYLVATFSTVSFVSNAWAMFIPSPHARAGASHRDADLQKIQKLLESKLIQEKLSQFGLIPAEIQARLSQLDDDQIHEIASQIRALEAGGSDVAVFIIFILAVLAGILILEVTGVIDILPWW